MYQFTCFSDDFNHGMIKNLKINKIQQVHQKIYTEQVLMVKITYCHIILRLNIK